MGGLVDPISINANGKMNNMPHIHQMHHVNRVSISVLKLCLNQHIFEIYFEFYPKKPKPKGPDTHIPSSRTNLSYKSK